MPPSVERKSPVNGCVCPLHVNKATSCRGVWRNLRMYQHAGRVVICTSGLILKLDGVWTHSVSGWQHTYVLPLYLCIAVKWSGKSITDNHSHATRRWWSHWFTEIPALVKLMVISSSINLLQQRISATRPKRKFTFILAQCFLITTFLNLILKLYYIILYMSSTVTISSSEMMVACAIQPETDQDKQFSTNSWR